MPYQVFAVKATGSGKSNSLLFGEPSEVALTSDSISPEVPRSESGVLLVPEPVRLQTLQRIFVESGLPFLCIGHFTLPTWLMFVPE